VSTNPQNDHADTEPLVATCRQLSRLLAQVKPSAALRIAAPALHEALPLVKALVLGLEDLVDRVALIEAGGRLSSGAHLALEATATNKRL
jgi:hypothetical protein